MSTVTTADHGDAGLTDAQQRMLLAMAADTIARRDRVTQAAGAGQLAAAATAGELQIVGDADHLAVVVRGRPVVQLVGKALRTLRALH